jgi:hypothetical protein
MRQGYPVSTVVIRRHPDAVTVLVDGQVVVSASDDDVPGEEPLSPALLAAQVAADMARALGASLEIEEQSR